MAHLPSGLLSPGRSGRAGAYQAVWWGCPGLLEEQARQRGAAQWSWREPGTVGHLCRPHEGMDWLGAPAVGRSSCAVGRGMLSRQDSFSSGGAHSQGRVTGRSLRVRKTSEETNDKKSERKSITGREKSLSKSPVAEKASDCLRSKSRRSLPGECRSPPASPAGSERVGSLSGALEALRQSGFLQVPFSDFCL